MRVLFVCMGNICRSPMAEGVFRRKVAEAGLTERVVIDSAGTIGAHAGEPPDSRAQRAAAGRGYALEDLRARQVAPEDCRRFDLILAMDRGNLNRLRRLCGGASDRSPAAGDDASPGTVASGADVRLFLDFAADRREQEVPDPYMGGQAGFELVMDLVEAGAEGLVAEVRRRLGA